MSACACVSFHTNHIFLLTTQIRHQEDERKKGHSTQDENRANDRADSTQRRISRL